MIAVQSWSHDAVRGIRYRLQELAVAVAPSNGFAEDYFPRDMKKSACQRSKFQECFHNTHDGLEREDSKVIEGRSSQQNYSE